MLGFRTAFYLCMLIAVTPAFLGQVESPQSSSRPKAKNQSHAAIAEISDGVYRNATFGFNYKIPFGWVDRTPDMQEGSESGKSQVLLAIFQRPPEARGEDINSAVVIATESASSYRGLKTAADYFGPIEELTTAKGFKVTHDPYAFSLGTKELVRGDFSKPRGTLTMYQSSLVILDKGTVISFTFIGGSEDEINGLVEGLSFGMGKRVR
ncbi:MAG: hypothetical protein NVS1B11_20780 [Terriglobales bacterium]